MDPTSNTKTALFLSYVDALPCFKDIVAATPQPNAIDTIKELPQDLTCSLHYGGDMLKLLSDGLVKHGQVESTAGEVTRAVWNEQVTNQPP